MHTPWLTLPPTAPYVLDSDRAAIETFNAHAQEQHRIRTEIVPEPFLGSPDAPVVLLNLNPGFTEQDLQLHKLPQFVESSRKCLRHESQPYPFFLLDPANDGPGHRWWSRKLRPLIDQFGAMRVAQNVLCVELFPYHSVRFGGGKLRVPSQQYSFDLVETALDRGALVVVMRSKKMWIEVVPRLKGYRRIGTTRSVQNPTISEANCERFGEIVEALTGS
ncbi:MAG: hypothetical protein ABI718_11355 [Acidobacteriota bacterium]